MKNFRDELREIFNSDVFEDRNEEFEAIDELHDKYYETLKQSQMKEDKIEYATAYQLLARGQYKNFSGEGKYHSQIIHVNEPTDKDKEKFKKKCCESKSSKDLYDLDPNKTEIEVLKLKLQIVDKK